MDADGTIDGSARIEGLLKGNSTVTGALSLVSGTLSSGNSAGITKVDANFTMDASSKLVAEVTGAVAGVSYNQVQVSGNISLAGPCLAEQIDAGRHDYADRSYGRGYDIGVLLDDSYERLLFRAYVKR